MKHLQKTILILTCFLSLHLNVLATLTTHEWQNNHRGYSIELIPGTGVAGIAPEYVAAGTVYDANHLYPGWHFMHLDDLGNVISERTSWAASGFNHEFRVVDIACESGNEFWITIQARYRTGGHIGGSVDYVYVAGVDLTGTDLPLNPAISIMANNQYYENIYPTHSYFADNGRLYICGYSAYGTAYPNEPNKYYGEKHGMLLTVDVATGTASSYFWNTGSTNGIDFDMPLKIAPYQYGETFPLLVTGALNTYFGPVATIGYEYISGVLVATFDANGVALTLSGLEPRIRFSMHGPEDARPEGTYGIDIRGGVYGGDGSNPELAPDIIVLVNDFDALNVPANLGYGIARIKNDLTTYPPFTNLSFNYTAPSSSTYSGLWAKQFLELHGNDYDNSSDNHITVIGEVSTFTDEWGCIPTLAAPSLPPALTNINPFIRDFYLGAGWFNYSTGFYPSMPPLNPTIFLSSQGTTATSMDYRGGSIAINAAREDISRLYTFSSIERFYDNPSMHNPISHKPGMVLPIADYPESVMNPYLKTKFLQTDFPPYKENDCQRYVEDCADKRFSDIVNVGIFEIPPYEVSTNNAYAIFTLTDVFNNFPSYTHCSTGYYKPGKSLGIKNAVDDNVISIYPNPATNELNIDLTNVDGKYEFVLADVTGKVVVENSGTGGNVVKVSLPVLSTGVYIATVSANEIVHTEKVVIK